MNCDQAFDLLTSGADANDAGCEASLDQHLAECAHCARLAEAMGPATDLFLAVNASHDDAYRRQESALKFVSMGTAGIIAPNWSERCSFEWPESARRWLPLAAAILVGLALSSLPLGQGGRERTNGVSGTRSATSAASLPAGVLASLRLTPACLPAAARGASMGDNRVRPAMELLAQLDVTDLACCTLCHAAGGAADVRAATQQVARSCSACHIN